jgi:hypothetical protein
MKKANFYLLLLSILTFGCGEENASEIQNLKDGEFIIRLYNSNGDLLLTKKGDAQNLVTSDSNWEIRLLDPSFGAQNSDPLETFASLTFFGQSSISTPKEFHFNNDNSAAFHQRWYSLDDDWGYKSIDGRLNITSVGNLQIKGSFEVKLEGDVNAQENPHWGQHILAKGYFSSICAYENVGGCP